MEYWIFVAITLIAVFLICLVVFILRCTEYNHVMRKMRTLSLSSGHQPDDDPESGRCRHERRELSEPPPYSLCLQHSIIARSSADAVPIAADRTERDRPEVAESVSGSSLPVDAYFIPPPYCLEPPSYDEIAEGSPPQGELPEVGRATDN